MKIIIVIRRNHKAKKENKKEHVRCSKLCDQVLKMKKEKKKKNKIEVRRPQK